MSSAVSSPYGRGRMVVVHADEGLMLEEDCPQVYPKVRLRFRGEELQPMIAIDDKDWMAAMPAALQCNGELAQLDGTVKELKLKLWHAAREKTKAVAQCEAEVRRIKESVKIGAREVTHAIVKANHGLDDARIHMHRLQKDCKYYHQLEYRRRAEIERLEAELAQLKQAHKSEETQRLALEKETTQKERTVADNRKRAAEQVELKREKRALIARETSLQAELEKAQSHTLQSEAARAMCEEQVQSLQRRAEEAEARTALPNEDVVMAHVVMGEFLTSQNELQAQELEETKRKLALARARIDTLAEAVGQYKPRKVRDNDELKSSRTHRRHHKEDVEYLISILSERHWQGDDLAEALDKAKLMESVFQSRLVRVA